MSSFISSSSIHAIASFTLTSFIDCITVLLDSFINHTTLFLPSLYHSSSLYTLLSHHSIDLLRVTPSRLLAACVAQPSIEHPLSIHLSGELLESSVLDLLETKLPHAHFFNVYGGFIHALVSCSASETAGDCSFFDCSLSHPRGSFVPIGEGLPEYRFRLEKDTSQLMISGDLLSLGEWNVGAFSEFPTGDRAEWMSPAGDKAVCRKSLIITGRLVDADEIKIAGIRYSKTALRRAFLQCAGVSGVWLTTISAGLAVVLLTEKTVDEVRREIRSKFPRFVVPWKGRAIQTIPFLAAKMTPEMIRRMVDDRENSLSGNEMAHSVNGSLIDSLSKDESVNEDTTNDSLSNSVNKDITTESLSRGILALMQSLVETPLHPETDFFSAGGDSLRALLFIEQFKQKYPRFPLTPEILFTHATAVSLAAFLSRPFPSLPPTPPKIPPKLPPIRESTLVQSIPFRRCVDCDPLGVDGDVICCCHGGILQRLTWRNGRLVPRFHVELQERVEKSLALWASTLLIGSYQGTVFFIDAATGAIERRWQIKGEIRSPMGIGGHVGALCAYNGYVYVFDLSSQQLLALRRLGGSCHATPLVIAVEENRQWVVCVTLRGVVQVLRLQDGRLTSECVVTMKRAVFATPLWMEGRVWVVDVEGEMTVMTLEGEVEERIDVGAKVQKGGLFHVAPVRVDDALFLVCTSGELVKVSMKTRQVSTIVMVEKGSCRGD